MRRAAAFGQLSHGCPYAPGIDQHCGSASRLLHCTPPHGVGTLTIQHLGFHEPRQQRIE